MEIKKAQKENIEEILDIYKSLLGYPGCTWNEEYPTLIDVEYDIEKDALYMIVDDYKIIGVATAVEDSYLKNLSCWNKEIKNPCELARVAVLKEYQNKGIAKEIIRYIENDIRSKGFDGIHFLVSKTNPRALNLYNSLSFSCCGEVVMCENDWFCYEKKLK